MTLLSRFLLVLTAVALAAPVSTVRADDDSAEGATATNPIETLVRERRFDQAIDQVQQMRVAAKKPLADPDSEYWAGRAETQLKLIEAARERYLAIARTYPGIPRGEDAAIEATTARLNTIPDGKASTPAQVKLAIDCAKELEATGAKLTIPDKISRAFYVAGNGWKMAGEADAALRAYEKSAAVPGGVDYPPKAMYSLATRKLQDFNVAGSRKILEDCMKQYPKTTGAEKCGKALSRLSLMGTPAAALDVETWLNGPPQDMAALKGNVVIVWFFATWCPHCKQTMPDMAALKQRFAGKPVRLIGITNNSRGQTTELAAAFVSDPQWGFTYPVATDRNGSTSLAYEGTGIPSAALVDKKGIVRWADHPVYLTDAMIEKLLAE